MVSEENPFLSLSFENAYVRINDIGGETPSDTISRVFGQRWLRRRREFSPSSDQVD